MRNVKDKEEKQYYLAIDIGASSGRHILGWMENGKIRMEEIYRFQNGLEKRNGHLCWNLDRLFDEVVAGLRECKRLDRIPTSVGIDTWGVDFVLLDAQGNVLGSPVAYRDSRTKGMDDVVYQTIPEAELYSRSGIQKQIFNTIYQLTAIRKMGVSHLTNEILSHRNTFESDFYNEYNFVCEDIAMGIQNNEVEDRIWRDWAVLLASYRCLLQCKSLDLPWTYDEMKNIVIDGIRRQNSECAASNEMGIFWDMFEYMSEQGMIYKEGDYKIKYMDEIKTNIVERKFVKTTPILMIRPKKIILQYKKASKQTDEKAMSERSIRFYLQTSPGFLGKKKGSERFKEIINGEVMRKKKYEDDPNSWIDLEKFDNPFCFDYSVLKAKFDLNLETNESEIVDDRPF